jgi:antitoxin ParD1/3/4
MRTNIDIDDDLMAAAMAAGAFKTKKEAVEAGLALLKRQADYARLLALKGKLRWGWDDEETAAAGLQAREPTVSLDAPQPAKQAKASTIISKAKGGARGRR